MIPVRAPGREAWAALVATLRTETPACEGDDRFTADEFDAELRRDLREVCSWCPIADACRAAAMSGRPDAGFWSGQVYGRERVKDQAPAGEAPAPHGLNRSPTRVSGTIRHHRKPRRRAHSARRIHERNDQMTIPDRATAFAAIAPTTPEAKAEHNAQWAAVVAQHALGLTLAQIVATASLARVSAIVHAPHLADLDSTDPEAAEVIRSTCYRRLIELSQ